MTVKLLIEHNLEFLNLEGGYTGSSESIHVKMTHCWKSHITAHIFVFAKSKGSFETMCMCRRCDKYQNFMCLPINEQNAKPKLETKLLDNQRSFENVY